MSIFEVFLVRIFPHLDSVSLRISSYSFRMWKNTDQKLRIRTLFTQCELCYIAAFWIRKNTDQKLRIRILFTQCELCYIVAFWIRLGWLGKRQVWLCKSKIKIWHIYKLEKKRNLSGGCNSKKRNSSNRLRGYCFREV